MTYPCNCIADFNARLAEHNTRIVQGLMRIDGEWFERPTIAGEQIETGRGKKKAVTIVPTFCPFCGVSYSPPKLEPEVEWTPIDEAPRDGRLVQLADEGGNRAVAMWAGEKGWAWSFGEGEPPSGIDFTPTRFRLLPEEEAR
jgi:hypothetical protein